MANERKQTNLLQKKGFFNNDFFNTWKDAQKYS